MSDKLKTVKSVKLINITENPDILIEKAGRICYGGTCKPEKVGKFVKARVKEGHLSLGRHATATFEIACSRACSHQLCRHPHISLHQRSQRYCNEQDFDFIYPPSILKKEANDDAVVVFNEVIKEIRNGYKKLVEMGIKKEDARFLLPNACKTKLILTGNFQGWYDFLKLRLSKHAQWEIREIAEEIRDMLVEKSKFFFEFKEEDRIRALAEDYHLDIDDQYFLPSIKDCNLVDVLFSLNLKIKELFPDFEFDTVFLDALSYYTNAIVVLFTKASMDETNEKVKIIHDWLIGEYGNEGLEVYIEENGGYNKIPVILHVQHIAFKFYYITED